MSISIFNVTIAAMVAAYFATGCGASVPYVPAGPPTSIHVPDPSDGKGYSVVVTDPSAKQMPPCRLPCDEQIPSGTSSFSFARDDGVFVFGSAIVPAAPSEVTFHRKRRGQLIAGGVLAIAGLALGFPLSIDTAGSGGGVSSTDLTLGVVGLGALLVGTIVMATSGSDGVDVK